MILLLIKRFAFSLKVTVELQFVMLTKPSTVQKTKNSGSFEFSLRNNSDVATDSSRIFHDFSHTMILRDLKYIVLLLCDRKKRRSLFQIGRSETEEASREIVYARIENTSGSKNAGKISKTHASSLKPKSESLITVFSARCTDSPIPLPFYFFILLSLSLSLSIFFFSLLCFFTLFIRSTRFAGKRLTADSSVNDVVVGSCPAFVLLPSAPREILRKELLSRFAARLVISASSNEFPPFLGARRKEETHYKNLPSYSFRDRDMFRRNLVASQYCSGLLI